MNEDLDAEARLLGFFDHAAHVEAHRLVSLPKDDPGAPSKGARAALKEALFLCHYGIRGCSVTRS